VNTPSWDDDDRLLFELGAAMRAGEAVPERFVELGKQAFTWYGIDAELAELSYDSAADRAPGFAVARGAAAELRALTFTSGDLVLELEITPAAVRGQVLPPGTGVVLVTGADGTSHTAAIDADGWFAVAIEPGQSFSLTVRIDGAAITTGPIVP
jgi:hypothetical protein